MSTPSDERVYGWRSVAAAMGCSQRHARDLVTRKGLIVGRREDGAVEVRLADLKALRAGWSETAAPAAPNLVLVAQEGLQPQAAPLATAEFVAANPPAPAPQVAEPDDADLGRRVRDLEREMKLTAFRMEMANRLAGENGAEVAAAMEEGETRLAATERASLIARARVETLERRNADLERRLGTIEALLSNLPMAPAPTQHTCPRCQRSKLISAVACPVCHLGAGPSGA